MEITWAEAPRIDGQYIAFVRADGMPEYARPLILTWYEADWRYPYSDVKYRPQVFAWMGPLPVGKIEELFPVQEFDL